MEEGLARPFLSARHVGGQVSRRGRFKDEVFGGFLHVRSATGPLPPLHKGALVKTSSVLSEHNGFRACRGTQIGNTYGAAACRSSSSRSSGRCWQSASST